jgi:hypothetical protein
MRQRIIPLAKFALVLAMTLTVFRASTFPDWMTGRPGPDVRLRVAIGFDDLGEFDLALADGASPANRGGFDTFPLAEAASTGRLEMSRRLIAAGADTNVADDHGMTPLMWAASQDFAEVTELLIYSGADVSRRDALHRTALDMALANHCSGAAQALRRAEIALDRYAQG